MNASDECDYPAAGVANCIWGSVLSTSCPSIKTCFTTQWQESMRELPCTASYNTEDWWQRSGEKTHRPSKDPSSTCKANHTQSIEETWKAHHKPTSWDGLPFPDLMIWFADLMYDGCSLLFRLMVFKPTSSEKLGASTFVRKKKKKTFLKSKDTLYTSHWKQGNPLLQGLIVFCLRGKSSWFDFMTDKFVIQKNVLFFSIKNFWPTKKLKTSGQQKRLKEWTGGCNSSFKPWISKQPCFLLDDSAAFPGFCLPLLGYQDTNNTWSWSFAGQRICYPLVN